MSKISKCKKNIRRLTYVPIDSRTESRSRTRLCLSASLTLSPGLPHRSPGRPSCPRLLPPPLELRTANACSLTSPPWLHSAAAIATFSSIAQPPCERGSLRRAGSPLLLLLIQIQVYSPPPKTQTLGYSPTAARVSLNAAVRCAYTPLCLRPVVCGSALLPRSTIGASSSNSRRQ
ncbi:uncharacterized protein DS421_1g00050 [Arachis hypogaea]|nr:uncharacterized protein DS421_1g00050 [Arachis hypogaea]